MGTTPTLHLPYAELTDPADANALSKNLALAVENAILAIGVPALIDAKGDLLAGSADNTIVRVPVGAAATVLTADPTKPGGMDWKVSTLAPPSLWISAAGAWPSLVGGCAPAALVTIGAADYFVLDFADSAAQYAQANVPIPNDYNGGVFSAKFFWTAGAGAGAAVWAISAASLADGENLGAAFGTEALVTDPLSGTGQLQMSAVATLTPNWTPAAGELMCFKFGRRGSDGPDTLTAPARLIGVRLEYTRA